MSRVEVIGKATIYLGDCREVLPTLDQADACVTDPPYELDFMGKKWDGTGIAFQPETWRLVYDALKPGAHLAAFGGTRTFHRMVCAIEDAGFEIRDTLMWLYGQGFNKVGYIKNDDGSHVREGWGGSLRPSWEPIILARKPFRGTIAANVLEHGTGALNIDACRIEAPDAPEMAAVSLNAGSRYVGILNGGKSSDAEPRTTSASRAGRWPANVLWSVPEDEHLLRSDVTAEQKQELFRWFHENT